MTDSEGFEIAGLDGKSDLERLERRVDELEAKVAKLEAYVHRPRVTLEQARRDLRSRAGQPWTKTTERFPGIAGEVVVQRLNAKPPHEAPG